MLTREEYRKWVGRPGVPHRRDSVSVWQTACAVSGAVVIAWAAGGGCVEVVPPQPGGSVTPPAGETMRARTLHVALQVGGELVALGELHEAASGVRMDLYGPGLPEGRSIAKGSAQKDGDLFVRGLQLSAEGEATPLKGQLRGRSFDAELTVDGQPATLRGAEANAPHRRARVAVEFDGGYELAFLDAQGEEVAATTIFVELGKLTVDLVMAGGEQRVPLAGYVTDDGTLVLDDADADHPRPFSAQATIDHDTYELRGVYRDGVRAGRVVGAGGGLRCARSLSRSASPWW